MLKRIVYVSRAAAHLTELNVQRIQWSSQVRNRRLDVTGMLVFTGRHFAQVLEGREEALQELMGSLSRDRRHSELRVVMDEPITTRRFDGWAMGYANRYEMADAAEELLEGRPDATGRIVQLFGAPASRSPYAFS